MNERPDAQAAAPEPRGVARPAWMRWVLGVVAVAAAGTAGVWLGFRVREWREPRQAPARSPLPEAHPIWDSWRAAKAGDVEAYLDCFTGPARARLEAVRDEQGAEAFARRLQEDAASVHGLAIEPRDAARQGEQAFRAAVVRGEEVEGLDYTVARVGPAWKIAAVVSRGHQPGPPDEGGGEAPGKQGERP